MNVPRAILLGSLMVALAILGAGYQARTPNWQVSAHPPYGVVRLNTQSGSIEVCANIAGDGANGWTIHKTGSGYQFSDAEFEEMKRVVEQAVRTGCFLLNAPR